MRKQSFILTIILTQFLLITTNIYAASYEEIMGQTIEKMYKAKTVDELQALSSVFYRVSEKENEQWLPLYYASYSLVRIAFFTKDEDEIDKHLDVAQEYLNKLLEEQSDVSEVHVLQGLLYSMRITSAARGMKYSMLSNSALEKAEALNNRNPRLYYCKANNVYHTPSMFGGGKKKALPIFKKAATLFESEKSDVPFWPSWGELHNKEMMAKCTEE